MKKHSIAGLLTVAVTMTGILAPVAFASQPTSSVSQTNGSSVAQAQHDLPILKVTPTDGATTVRPDAPIQIFLDQNAKTYQRYHQQFVNGTFQVTLNGQAVTASYDDTTNTITVHNDALSRYTTYTVAIAMKASLNSNGNANGASASTYQFSFQTGSAIGEATHVQASVSSSSVSVIKGGDLNVAVTDDYGDAATSATVNVTGNGPGNSRLASSLSVAQCTPVSNGSADIALADHTAETVSLNYTVQDNTYHDAVDTNTGAASEQFLPGPTAQIHVTNPDKIVAGGSYNFTGDAEDVYGNSVLDGTALNESAGRGVVSNAQPTSNGNYSFGYTAPTKAGADTLTVTASDSAYQTMDGLTVVHADPANVKITLPSTLTVGQKANVSGTLTDKYGNPVDSSSVSFTGALTGTLTTGADGTFAGSLTVGQSGTVSANVNGQLLTITTPTGQAITSITATSGSNVATLPGTWAQVGALPASSLQNPDPFTGGYYTYGGGGWYSWGTYSDYLSLYNQNHQLVRKVYGPTFSGTMMQTDVLASNGDIVVATFGNPGWGKPRGVFMYNNATGSWQTILQIPYDPFNQAETGGVAFDQKTGDIYFTQQHYDFVTRSYTSNLYKWDARTHTVSIVEYNIGGKVLYDGTTRQILVDSEQYDSSQKKWADVIHKYDLDNNLASSTFVFPGAPGNQYLAAPISEPDTNVDSSGNVWFFDYGYLWKYNPGTDNVQVSKIPGTTNYNALPYFGNNLFVNADESVTVKPWGQNAFQFTPQ